MELSIGSDGVLVLLHDLGKWKGLVDGFIKIICVCVDGDIDGMETQEEGMDKVSLLKKGRFGDDTKRKGEYYTCVLCGTVINTTWVRLVCCCNPNSGFTF